jgi:gliding motility-associated-like protein
MTFKRIMKKIATLLFGICFFGLQATHNRAGEITYKWLNGFTYEVTITTYTRACELCADRCDLTINWGDGSSDVLLRNNGNNTRCLTGRDGVIIDQVNRIRKNTYTGTHTYPAAGSYLIYMEDRNRNAGISNIINSDQVPFYIASELFISPSLGPNSSPVLTNPPVERGCKDRRFEHNPGAFDPDGDSLAYRLTFSRTENGDPIQTIYDSQYVQDSVKIDPTTGLFYWDVPKNVGQYNFAFEIVEFRKNAQGRYVRIGYVTRDLQIDIEDCPNNPPEILPIGPFCVEAGTNLNFVVQADDQDNDVVDLTAFGGPFITNPAASFSGATGLPIVSGFFNWATTCDLVRKQPYQVTFKAEDAPAFNDIPLTDLYTTEITVVAPAPQNPSAGPEGRALRLNWDPSICAQAKGYLIYRRESTYGFVPSECETGVPAYTGYEFIDSLSSGVAISSYLDNQNVETGKLYCYMVVAYFADEAESYASEEFCAALPLNLPMLTKVDVASTSTVTGDIDIEWIAPPEFDSVVFPPPYQYELKRSSTENTGNAVLISTQNGLVNGQFNDQGLNTRDSSYVYTIDLYSGPNRDFVGSSSKASSVFLKTSGLDSGMQLDFEFKTPWQNDRFVIYRENPRGSGNFDSIAESFTPSYRDTGLTNGENYCYYVKSVGRYTASDSLPQPLLNRSQISCNVARDTIAPCTPQFSLRNVCPDTIYFSWRLQDLGNCSNDVARINIYFRTGTGGYGDTPFLSIPAKGDSTIKFVSDSPIFGCYAATAVDDAGNDPGGTDNESPLSSEVCIQSCFTIGFPNVFSPNNDGVNDEFLPTEIDQVKDLEIQIYNRWGGLVYEAKSVEEFLSPGWTGQSQQLNAPAPEGVYYYVCSFTAESLGDSSEQVATGFVHLFR